MVKVSVELVKRDFVWIGLVVILISAGFGIAAWDNSKAMFHDDADVRVFFNGSERSLSEALSIIEAGGGFGGATGGMSFGAWEDVTSSATNGVVQPASLTDGFVIAYTPSASGGTYDIHGYTPDNSLKISHKSAAVYAENPTQHFTMPVKKGDTWKITGSIAKVWWLPIISSGSGGIENIRMEGSGETTVTATCSEGKSVKFAVAFTNDHNNPCDSTTRDNQCSKTSFPSCIDQSSCTYVGDKNSCGSAGKTCLQVICG